ncbi:CvpA family protein [Altererythrobacter confluentis]|uniref:CvpA family protein n=1 Tax=Allopontixanthobacter confluentis TaxID=1849021 RepID=A0A6L7GDR9_9SPHN|nr:CvpA family protein [Allopontixanthobacter confluentis]MXP14089.1 CvpA family protein [Allopontixanthobacter confluentis]
MTGFDIIVLIIVGVASIGGFLRGFVQEVLSLAAWILAVFAIHYLHTPLYEFIEPRIGTPSGAAILAFVLLLLIPYAAMKLIAGRAGNAARSSVLGPIDRVLGFGFGAIKGGIIVVLAFSLLVLGYDTAWGVAGRPAWITTARTYPLVNASADALVKLIQDRRSTLREADQDAAPQ